MLNMCMTAKAFSVWKMVLGSEVFFGSNGHQQNMVIPKNLNVKKAIDKEWPFDAECLCDFFWHACFGRTRPCREIYLLAAYQQFFTCICVHIIYFCICLTSPI